MKKIAALILSVSMSFSMIALTGCDQPVEKPAESSVTEKSTASKEPEVSQQSEEDEISDIVSTVSKPDLTTAQLEQLNSFLNGYKDVPQFTCQSPAIHAAEITKGKTITLIPDNSSKSFTELVSSEFKKAAKAAGFGKTIVNASDGTATFFNQSLTEAVDNTDIAIMYGDINKDLSSAAIERVQANGIRVLSAGTVGKGEKDHFVDEAIPINYQLAGRLLADWAVTQKKGRVNALAVNNSDSTLTASVYKGFAEEFEKNVTNGYCTVISGSAIEIGNGMAAKIRKAIEADPNLNYIVVLDEAMINDAVSAVGQVGRKDLKVIATGGGKEAFDAAQADNLEILVAQSYEWIAYAMVDYAVRVLDKAELPQEQDVPVRIVNAAVIKDTMDKNTYTEISSFYELCFGSNFVAGYDRLWSGE